MSDRARAIWDELVELLERVGVLSELDGRALGDLAEVEAMLETTRRARVRRRRLMRKSRNGYEQVDELVALEVKLMREARRLRAAFGLSPADRSRLATAEPRGDDENEDDLDP